MIEDFLQPVASKETNSIAFFLDRDGTLVEECNYLSRLEDLHIYPRAIEAVRRINRSGALALVTSNQSGIARGLITRSEVETIHAAIISRFSREGARIDRIYYCPHHPEFGSPPLRRSCRCRKPQPGLLLRAQSEFKIKLSRSVMIGDKLDDVEAGHRAGCRTILVRTGHGSEAITELEDFSGAEDGPRSLRRPDHIAEDVLDAVSWALEHTIE